MTATEELLQIERVTKVFTVGSFFFKTRINAVENVSFGIKPAEIFTLAGESGCGKSTIAKIILGFEEKTAGEIVFENESIAHWREKRQLFIQKVQAVFQNPFESFNPLCAVDDIFFETVYNFHLVQNEKEAIPFIDERLKAVGLSFSEIHSRYPSELSGGQLQRASIARALLTNPSLLVADEPVSMVDASLRMSIVNLFARLREEMNLSVLYITHDLATAYYVSDRIAVMFRGNIVEMGPVEEVLLNPRHPYTQLLRDSIPEANPHRKWKGSVRVANVEEEEYLQKGCKFAGRCSLAEERCRVDFPQETLVDGVLVRCHRYN